MYSTLVCWCPVLWWRCCHLHHLVVNTLCPHSTFTWSALRGQCPDVHFHRFRRIHLGGGYCQEMVTQLDTEHVQAPLLCRNKRVHIHITVDFCQLLLLTQNSSRYILAGRRCIVEQNINTIRHCTPVATLSLTLEMHFNMRSYLIAIAAPMLRPM